MHVWQASPSPAPPYATWASAATNIQDAIDAALPGEDIVVTNGVYATGGRVVDTAGTTTNRVAVTKPVTVRSVNGPAVTVIEGHGPQDGAVRCVYLTDSAALAGFTLTNGWGGGVGGGGGGVWCESSDSVATNCVLVGNSAFPNGGGAYRGTLNNCTLANNFASHGGGAESATLNSCVLSTNRAGSHGGGASECLLNNCTLTGNSAPGGGGVSGGTLVNCTLFGNSANSGGGAISSALSDCILSNCILSNNLAKGGPGSSGAGGGTARCHLSNCTLVANRAVAGGGGASEGSLNNCTLTANAAVLGGGARFSTLNNCTVAGNSGEFGGGVDGGWLTNCIVYHNAAPTGPNYYVAEGYSGSISFTCTFPLPTNGTGNLTNEPAFVDLAGGNLRLQSNSPCINAGRNAFASAGADLDGLPRLAGGTVDLGAYEFQTPASTLSYAWLLQYGLSLDGSADTADPDGDFFPNYHEWRAGTDPTNALSLLRLLPPVPLGSDLAVSWQSVPGRSYVLEASMDLGTSSPRPSPPLRAEEREKNAVTSRFTVLATGLPALSGTNTTTFTHTNAAVPGPWFYRVGVEE
jgi:hypothetical protein